MITIKNKTIEINDTRLHDLVVKKDAIVMEGRKISEHIDIINKRCKLLEEREQRITSSVIPPKELTDKGDEITIQMAKLEDELNKIGKEIHDSKLDAVPQKIKDEHLALLKEKEVLERDRNKLALKAQKIKDKVVPIIQKEVKPLLQESDIQSIDVGKYNDIGTAKPRNGVLIIDKMNWLDEWIKKFGK